MKQGRASIICKYRLSPHRCRYVTSANSTLDITTCYSGPCLPCARQAPARPSLLVVLRLPVQENSLSPSSPSQQHSITSIHLTKTTAPPPSVPFFVASFLRYPQLLVLIARTCVSAAAAARVPTRNLLRTLIRHDLVDNHPREGVKNIPQDYQRRHSQRTHKHLRPLLPFPHHTAIRPEWPPKPSTSQRTSRSRRRMSMPSSSSMASTQPSLRARSHQ